VSHSLQHYNLLFADIEIDMVQLVEGTTYFVTITACNTADLCSSATSDGFVVDSTPPLPGHVIDGNLADDMNYQGSRYSQHFLPNNRLNTDQMIA